MNAMSISTLSDNIPTSQGAFCECGCDGTPKKGNRFINGHNSRFKKSESHKMRIGLAQKKAWASGNRPHKTATYLMKWCKKCNHVFFILKTHKKNKFCSSACFSIFMKKNMGGHANPFFGKKHSAETIRTIVGKNKGFRHSDEAKKKMSLHRKGRKFSVQHKKRIGDALRKHPVDYLSNKRAEKQRIRKSTKYKEWRSTVFERDNWTCQMCFSRSEPGKAVSLEAHHVKSFRYHQDLRFCVHNGITLCVECHKDVSRKNMVGNKNGCKNT
jgi:hypothetical protein